MQETKKCFQLKITGYEVMTYENVTTNIKYVCNSWNKGIVAYKINKKIVLQKRFYSDKMLLKNENASINKPGAAKMHYARNLMDLAVIKRKKGGVR